GYQIPYAEGKELNSQVFKWLQDNKDRRFFLWMHYMDPHEPFVPPEEYLQRDNIQTRRDAYLFNVSCGLNPSVKQCQELYELYKLEVIYVDTCIGNFLEFLDTYGMIDDSLIVLLADHGQGFMEHGYFAHPPHSLYNELVHVPLIIYGSEEPKVITKNVQLLDLAPTILDLIEVNSPTEFLGTSLLSIEQDEFQERPIFLESAKSDLNKLRFDLRYKIVACIYGNMKLIINDATNTVELYDLQRDFHEENNIANLEEGACKEFKKFIVEHVKKINQLRKTYG
ncbi:MAG: sulfatase-like hydrolase/transferase, partial [Candidatus Bathyarchaeia archaeon]